MAKSPYLHKGLIKKHMTKTQKYTLATKKDISLAKAVTSQSRLRKDREGERRLHLNFGLYWDQSPVDHPATYLVEKRPNVKQDILNEIYKDYIRQQEAEITPSPWIKEYIHPQKMRQLLLKTTFQANK